MKVVATIEARMSSSRLPGKVMLPVAGKPMLEQLVGRLRQCKSVDEIRILSSVRPENKVIRDLAETLGVSFYAGSEEDVMGRIINGTEDLDADIIVQLTGDNPAICSQMVDQLVDHLIKHNVDFASNYLTQNVLIGLNIRAFRRKAIVEADKICTDAKMRSHGGYFIQTRPDIFSLSEVEVDPCILRSDIRLTVDEPEDYKVINYLFTAFVGAENTFDYIDILNFFDLNPDVKLINQAIEQKIPGTG